MAQVNLGFTIVNMVYAIINKVIQKLSEGEADEEEDTEQTDNSLSDDDFAKLAETKTELREMLTSFYATHGIAPPATLDQAVDTFFSDQLKLQANFATKSGVGFLPVKETLEETLEHKLHVERHVRAELDAALAQVEELKAKYE